MSRKSKKIQLLEIAKSFLDKFNILYLIFFIFIFNILDATLTLLWLESGYAEEMNPIMAEALEYGHLEFLIAKIVLVGMGCFLIWRRRDNYIAKCGAALGFFVYSSLLIYHMLGYLYFVS